MKKVSSLLLRCVCVIGFVIIFSGVASALMIVGDPYEGNSWRQRFRGTGIGDFDTIQFIMESDNYFKNPGIDNLSDSNWSTDSYSYDYLSGSGSTLNDLEWDLVFHGDLLQPLSFLFLARKGGDFGTVRESSRLFWNGFNWKCEPTTNSVPDADIMWLLGPAFIMMGLLGRKKVFKMSQ